MKGEHKKPVQTSQITFGVWILLFILVLTWLLVCATANRDDGRGGIVRQERPTRVESMRTHVDRNRGRRRNRNRSGQPQRAGRRNRGRPSSLSSRQSRGPERFGCERIYLPMCKGLVPYSYTKLPNEFGHTTQLEVYQVLEHLWGYMDHDCSSNVRYLACLKYLPKCRGRRQPLKPCKRLCMTAKNRCSGPFQEFFNLEWDTKFPCQGLSNKKCIRPLRERSCQYSHPQCIENNLINVCSNLSLTQGYLPNLYHQCSINDLNTELSMYDSLIATNCHADLRFLLCGAYSPFCVLPTTMFSTPCRELCEEIRTACEARYRELNHNLPWPNKLQCHRLPYSTMSSRHCVMPTDRSLTSF